jgi:Ca2+-transporting ATPase
MTTAVLLGMMLAFEPKERGIMDQPPRDPKSPIINGELVFRILFVGVLLLIGSYWVFIYERRQGMDLKKAQTLATNILVFGELFYLFACRSLRYSMFKIGLFTNKPLLGGALTMAALQMALTYVPWFQALFHTQSLAYSKWLYVLGIGLTVYVLVEIEKNIRLGLDRRNGQ